MARENRYDYYIGIAEKVAERSTCRENVGAVLVAENGRILSTGYNGSISEAPHCNDSSCMLDEDNHCIRTIHAEMNALLFLKHKEENMDIFVTHQPCLNCFKALLQAGVTDIYYDKKYEDNRRDRLVNELKINNMVVEDHVRGFGHYYFTENPHCSIPGFTNYNNPDVAGGIW